MLKQVAWIGLPVDTLFVAIEQVGSLLTTGAGPSRSIAAVLSAAVIGGPVMGMRYVALFALLFGNRPGFVQRLLAPLGRMSLTAYLASVAIAARSCTDTGLGSAQGLD